MAVNDQIDPVSGVVYPYVLCHVVRRAYPIDCPMFEAGPNCLNHNPMPQPSTEGQEVK